MNRWKITGIIESNASKEQIIDDLDQLGFAHYTVQLEKKDEPPISLFDKMMGR